MKNISRTKLILSTVVVLAFFLHLHAKEKQQVAEANVNIQAANYTLVPEANGKYSMLGTASWYSRHSPGVNKRTANNENFNDTEMTCAIWGPEFNSRVKVTNLKNGKSIILRVNDRGPHGRYFREGRIIDLTQAAFSKLSDSKKGLINVKVEFL